MITQVILIHALNIFSEFIQIIVGKDIFVNKLRTMNLHIKWISRKMQDRSTQKLTRITILANYWERIINDLS